MITKNVVLIRLKHKIFEKSILTSVDPIFSKKVKVVWHSCKDFVVVNGVNFGQNLTFKVHKKLIY